MRFLRLSLLAGLVGLACTGCLDFDKETAVAVFRPDKDEVRVLFVYEGLHVSGKSDSDLDNARKALRALFAERKGFYLGHPLFAVDLGPPKDGKESDQDRANREFANKHIDVQKCILFPGKEGQFNGAQTIVIHEATKFVDGLNALLSQEMAEKLKKPDKSYDAATIALLKKAVADKHAWFRLEPGRISFAFPGSAEYLASAKREFLESLGVKAVRDMVNPPPPPMPKGNTIVLDRKNNLDKLPLREQLAAHLKEFEALETFFAETPLSVDQRRDQITIAVGVGDGEPLRVTSPYHSQEAGNKAADLLTYARTLNVPFQERATPDGLIAAFLKEHSTK